MTRTFAILLAGLAACAPGGDGAYRQDAVPIRSIALFQQSRLDGAWNEVAGYSLRPGCAGGRVVFAEGGTSAVSESCHLPLAATARLTASGPGRFSSGGAEYWVLWVDEEYRTMVLGTPSGRFASILNRGETIREDRLAAARKVLEFNGYDTGRLEVR